MQVFVCLNAFLQRPIILLSYLAMNDKMLLSHFLFTTDSKQNLKKFLKPGKIEEMFSLGPTLLFHCLFYLEDMVNQERQAYSVISVLGLDQEKKTGKKIGIQVNKYLLATYTF